MPADSHCFVAGQAHKSAYYVYRLFAVTVGQCVVVVIIRNLFPLPGLVILDVARAHNVCIYLADVVKQGGDGYRFVAEFKPEGLFRSVRFEVGFQAVVNVKAVFAQTALIGTVELGRCGSGEKVALGLQKLQKLVSTVAFDVCAENIYKSFL